MLLFKKTGRRLEGYLLAHPKIVLKSCKLFAFEDFNLLINYLLSGDQENWANKPFLKKIIYA
jgi:hypothetical protein